ncbi:hypothetical protein ACFFQW_46465 [Umezawaea endophytica]|uniref:Uncharacterized protein n=1 Tax=Umezawaea endophytica TaxID=1654476 RepID=A0A9X2VVU4_9PSEU|nr:hypothetical protein [Umezawaea endophytica]MCS7483783.1 hypothetical protein [Umezawaea endophytica]
MAVRVAVDGPTASGSAAHKAPGVSAMRAWTRRRTSIWTGLQDSIRLWITTDSATALPRRDQRGRSTTSARHERPRQVGITVAASTVWQILKDAGIDPTTDRTSTTWTDFLRSQAETLLAFDFVEIPTLTGTRLHKLAVIEHTNRRIRVLGATAHPTAA